MTTTAPVRLPSMTTPTLQAEALRTAHHQGWRGLLAEGRATDPLSTIHWLCPHVHATVAEAEACALRKRDTGRA